MDKVKLMAAVCACCPMCILARKYPQGKVAKIVEKEKAHCPFCKAYDELAEQQRNQQA